MSWITTLLVSLLSLGAGVMGGYGALYWRYSSECHTLLQQTKAKAAEASKVLEAEFKELQTSHTHCLQGESEWQRKCQEQQNQAKSAHTALTTKHQALLEEHAHALDRVTAYQKESESQQQIIHSLRDQVNQLQQGDQHKAEITRLRQQLATTESLLQEKTQEVHSLEEQLSQTTNTFASSQILSNMKMAIQRQYLAQTILQYQTHGPFRVEFKLDVGNWGGSGGEHGVEVAGGAGGGEEESLQTFVVELASTESYSMTMGTFLKLAQAGLYVGTTLRYDDTLGLLVGGNPQRAASKRVQSNLIRRLAEHGYGLTPFLWMEQPATSSSSSSSVQEQPQTLYEKCQTQPGSFWFPTQGQQFQITLPPNAKAAEQVEEEMAVSSSNNNNDGPMCHGRIVQGLSVLYKVFAPTILEDEENRPRITIANSRVFVLDSQHQQPHHHQHDSATSPQQWRPATARDEL